MFGRGRMNKGIRSMGYVLLSAGMAACLYILMHEFGHMMVMLLAGATIMDFSIFTAHVSAVGGEYTDFLYMWMHANGALLPFVLFVLYVLLYRKDSKKSFYRIFSYMATLIPVCSLLAWVIVPFLYMRGNAPVNDDVTKFLAVFCTKHHPLVVSAAAAVLIGIGVGLMVKRRVFYNFIEEISAEGR